MGPLRTVGKKYPKAVLFAMKDLIRARKIVDSNGNALFISVWFPVRACEVEFSVRIAGVKRDSPSTYQSFYSTCLWLQPVKLISYSGHPDVVQAKSSLAEKTPEHRSLGCH